MQSNARLFENTPENNNKLLQTPKGFNIQTTPDKNMEIGISRSDFKTP